MKICSNLDCPYNGRPQANSNFYKKKRQCRTCIRAKALIWRGGIRELRETSAFAIDRERKMRLPIGPWRAWLLNAEASIEASNHQATLAARLNISERRLWSWTRDQRQRSVDLDLVDQAVCAWGDPRILREVYPELYETCAHCGLTGLHTNACSKATAASEQAAA